MLKNQFFCVLATQSNDKPYCSLVSYAVSNNYKEIIFPTLRNTSKYNNLKQNPNISLLIDTRTNRKNDLTDAQALTVLGTANEINKKLYENYYEIYLNKHPDLKDFVTNRDCSLITIKVCKYILVSNFQNVIEYSVME